MHLYFKGKNNIVFTQYYFFIPLALVISQKAVNSEALQKKVSLLLGTLWLDYKDISLFILSFIHRSIVNERNDYTPEHNERLEFLGDAVLELIITQRLYQNFPKTSEGDMTDMRSALVRGRNLAEVSAKLWFQEYLLLWKGEEKSWGRNNDYILANTFEAFLWAIYLDSWYTAAESFVDEHVYSTLSNILDKKLFKDFKTLLQEYVQAEYDITPHYDVISDSGPDHSKNYVVWAFIWEKCTWKWEWSSKKKAQEAAAENAYITLKP